MRGRGRRGENRGYVETRFSRGLRCGNSTAANAVQMPHVDYQSDANALAAWSLTLAATRTTTQFATRCHALAAWSLTLAATLRVKPIRHAMPRPRGVVPHACGYTDDDSIRYAMPRPCGVVSHVRRYTPATHKAHRCHALAAWSLTFAATPQLHTRLIDATPLRRGLSRSTPHPLRAY